MLLLLQRLLLLLLQKCPTTNAAVAVAIGMHQCTSPMHGKVEGENSTSLPVTGHFRGFDSTPNTDTTRHITATSQQRTNTHSAWESHGKRQVSDRYLGYRLWYWQLSLITRLFTDLGSISPHTYTHYLTPMWYDGPGIWSSTPAAGMSVKGDSSRQTSFGGKSGLIMSGSAPGVLLSRGSAFWVWEENKWRANILQAISRDTRISVGGIV